MGNPCGDTPSDPYHVNPCMLSYRRAVVLNSATKVPKFESGKVLNEKTFCYIVISNTFATFTFTCKPFLGRGYSDDRYLNVWHLLMQILAQTRKVLKLINAITH